MKTVRQWWVSLLEREKRLARLAGVVLVVFLGYLIFIYPLFHRIEYLKLKIKSDRELIVWMQKSAGEISQLERSGYQTLAQKKGLSGVVEQTLRDYHLTTYVGHIEQTNPSQLSLTFPKVPFDSFIMWIQKLSAHYGIYVSELRAQRTTVSGVVSISLTVTVAQE